MRRHLEDGLVLRSLSEGFESDRANLAQFYVDVFGEDSGDDESGMGLWTADLLSDRHPTTTLDDFWVVVDTTKNDMIVSALLIIPQTWSYEDVPFDVARLELIATLKDYRNRGLVRRLMHVAHERSEAQGHMMQVITGILNYYRQFGYGMSLDLGTRATMPISTIRPLPADKEPTCRLRPADESDIPNLIQWDAQYARNYSLSVVRSPEAWRYEMVGRTEDSPFAQYVYIIHHKDLGDVGYVMLRLNPSMARSYVLYHYILNDQTSYLATFDDVMRGLVAIRDEIIPDEAKRPDMLRFDSSLPEVLDVMVRKTVSSSVLPYTYAWYIRVPDLVAFLKHIAPVLERRLEGSAAHKYTGEFKISFFNQYGVTMSFDQGKLQDVSYGSMRYEKSHAAFADHYFLDVLLGHRSPYQIREIVPETFTRRDGEVLCNILFPVMRGGVVPLA